METFLFKMILSSSIFIGFYYLILERQKAHRFKRFYLLLSILFSMLIPFVSITYGTTTEVSHELLLVKGQGEMVPLLIVEESVFTFNNIIYAIYVPVTFFLLMRFLISLNALRKEIILGKKIKKGNFTVVLKEEKATAHSFWKYIFLNREDFEKGKIDEKIIRHEETHLKQKHSLDVLLIEFLLSVFWFNPAFYFYKKAMLTNHEFLADESVLKAETNVKDYQKLLLTELISEKILFTNQFNLSNTKKRIDMMTKKSNYKSKLYSWFSLPLTAILFFVFAEKVPAKSEIRKPTKKAFNPAKIKHNIKERAVVPIKVVDTTKKPTMEDMRIKEMELQKAKENVDAAMKKLHKKNMELKKIREQIPPPTLEDNKAQLSQDVDQLPNFPGGINNFRSQVAYNFNTAVMTGNEGTVRSTLYFVINSDGSTSNYRSEGENEVFNNEALRAIKVSNESSKWEPAVKDGKPTSYMFKIPLTMSFH